MILKMDMIVILQNNLNKAVVIVQVLQLQAVVLQVTIHLIQIIAIATIMINKKKLLINQLLMVKMQLFQKDNPLIQ